MLFIVQFKMYSIYFLLAENCLKHLKMYKDVLATCESLNATTWTWGFLN